MTNDVCFVDLMEAAILKNFLARRRFSHFYDAEMRLLRNKWSSGVFKQHYPINHFDLLRKIRFVHTRRNRIWIDPNIAFPMVKKKAELKNNIEIKQWSKDTYLYRQLLPIITIVSQFSGEKRVWSHKIALWTFVVVMTLCFAEKRHITSRQENNIFRSAFNAKMQQYEMAMFILFIKRK